MLKGVNALDHGIDQSWQQDNQAWWDWYVTLADNTDQCDDESLVELPPIPHFDVGLEHSIEDELSKPYTVTKPTILLQSLATCCRMPPHQKELGEQTLLRNAGLSQSLYWP